MPIAEVLATLERALQRGVEVVVLVPTQLEEAIPDAAGRHPFDLLAAVRRYPNFTLAGIAGRNPRGGRSNIYVHDKIMLVDDAWATIGSCNLHRYSLFGHSELNATVWDSGMVQALRCKLLAEHLGQDTTPLDDIAALRLYRQIAEQNRRKRDAGDAAWQGLAIAL